MTASAVHTPSRADAVPRHVRAVRAVLLAAVAVAAGLVASPVGGATAAEGDVTWTVRTASNDLGADRTSYEYAVNPGTAVEDAHVVANGGTAPLDLAVYAADGYTTEAGQFDLVLGGEESVGVGAWVTGATDHITVEPGTSVEVPFTVSVPADATPGDYAGGIVTSLAQPGDTEGITVDRRLGVRIALRVGGELAPALAVEDVRLGYGGGLNSFAGGDATVSYTIHNTGNAVLSAQQAATVEGPFGWFDAAAGEVDAPPQLLPGESWEVTVPVDDVAAAVRLAATVSVTPVLTDPSGSTTALEPVVATAGAWAVPWALVGLVVLLVAAALVARRVRAQRRAQRAAREEARVREAVEEALSKVDAGVR